MEGKTDRMNEAKIINNGSHNYVNDIGNRDSIFGNSHFLVIYEVSTIQHE